MAALGGVLGSCSSPASPAREGRQAGGNDIKPSRAEYLIEVMGPPELYLSADDMRCPGVDEDIGARSDISDIPINAFRRKDGTVIVFSGNQNNYYLVGKSVDSARRLNCDQLIHPVNDPEPSRYNARRWMFGAYGKDYNLIIGFVHNEYHGDDFSPGACQRSSQANFECWYASTTLVTSTDGGFTFKAPKSPDNVLASLPWQFEFGQRRAGLFSPKVVGNPKDGMVYVMVTYVDQNEKRPIGQCLLRGSGKQLTDWRGWDGSGFNLAMGSPYAQRNSNRQCASVLNFSVRSLKYVSSINQFIAIGNHGERILYSFSPDLIHWSQRQTLRGIDEDENTGGKEMYVSSQNSKRVGGGIPSKTYFSIIDSESKSMNFDTVDGNPYLYYIQRHDHGVKRDVFRVPIRISR